MLLRAVERTPTRAGMSFQDYRRGYRPPELYYRDIFDAQSEALVVREESPDSFRSSGGRITYV